MPNATYEIVHELDKAGIQLAYRTRPGGYYPSHWHDGLEIIYPLNGDAYIDIEGKRHPLLTKRILVIAPRQVHSTSCSSRVGMFLCIHISEKLMEKYLPDANLYRIACYPDEYTEEQAPAYERICELLGQMTKLYLTDSPAANLESEGIILQILALLIRHFSVKNIDLPISQVDPRTKERLVDVLTWVDEHYAEHLSTDDAADHLGLSVEYFCRFFKKNMNVTFLQYVNEVRITHAYQDLLNTDLSVAEIAEQNGLTNQKLFNRTFKAIYGCTPTAVREGECDCAEN